MGHRGEWRFCESGMERNATIDNQLSKIHRLLSFSEASIPVVAEVTRGAMLIVKRMRCFARAYDRAASMRVLVEEPENGSCI